MNRTHNKILFVILALASLTFIISGMAGAVGTDEFDVVLQAGIANNGAIPPLGSIGAIALNTLLTDGNPSNDPLIVDLRTADEYCKGHIVGSINVHYRTLGDVNVINSLSSALLTHVANGGANSIVSSWQQAP